MPAYTKAAYFAAGPNAASKRSDQAVSSCFKSFIERSRYVVGRDLVCLGANPVRRRSQPQAEIIILLLAKNGNLSPCVIAQAITVDSSQIGTAFFKAKLTMVTFCQTI